MFQGVSLLKKVGLAAVLASVFAIAAHAGDPVASSTSRRSTEAQCLIKFLEISTTTGTSPGAAVASWSDQRKLRYIESIFNKKLSDRETDGILKAMHSTNWEVGQDGVHTATFGNQSSQQIAKKREILIQSGFDETAADRIIESGAADTPKQTYDPHWAAKRAAFLQSHGLTESEAQAIESYTSNGYLKINRALRGQSVTSAESESQIRLLDQALEKMPTYQGISYRAQRLRPDFDVRRYPIGGTILLDSFWSSSVSKGVAEDWSADTRHILYEITGGGQGRRVDDLSFFKTETEVLFRPGTRFKILDRRVDSQGNYVFRLAEETQSRALSATSSVLSKAFQQTVSDGISEIHKLRLDPKVDSVEKIDWTRNSGKWLPEEVSKKLGQRVMNLDPRIQSSILAVYNIMHDPAEFERYMSKLMDDTATEIRQRGTPMELADLANGKVSRNSVLKTLVKRFRSRGERISTLTTESHEDFRSAVTNGPFFDKPQGPDRHGMDMHLLQRDYVHAVVTKATAGHPQDFWDFLGQNRGISFWVPLFDANENDGVVSLGSPETLRHIAMKFAPFQ